MTLSTIDSITIPPLNCAEIKNCNKPNCPANTSDKACFLIENVQCETKRNLGTCIGCPVFEKAQNEYGELAVLSAITNERTSPFSLQERVSENNPTVFIIEDNRMSGFLQQKKLEKKGMNVVLAKNYEEVQAQIDQTPFCFVILDGQFPNSPEEIRTPPLGIIIMLRLIQDGFPVERIICSSKDKNVVAIANELGITCKEKNNDAPSEVLLRAKEGCKRPGRK